MNDDKRKQLRRAVALIEEAKTFVEAVKDEEEAAFDGMPENLQGSERGQAMEESAEILGSASSSLDEVIEQLQDIIAR